MQIRVRLILMGENSFVLKGTVCLPRKHRLVFLTNKSSSTNEQLNSQSFVLKGIVQSDSKSNGMVLHWKNSEKLSMFQLHVWIKTRSCPAQWLPLEKRSLSTSAINFASLQRCEPLGNTSKKLQFCSISKEKTENLTPET